MEFFAALGLDVKALIAQLVNFAILLIVLYKIGYKPIMSFIEKRTDKIEEGLANAKKAEQAYQDASAKQTEVIVQARKEAQGILGEAKEAAKIQREEIIEKTRSEVRRMLEQAQKDIVSEREKMLREVKDEVVDMVMESTKQILNGAVTQEVNKSWLEKQLAKVKK